MLQGRLLLFEWSLPLLPVITLLLVRLILDLRNHLIMMMVVITLMAVPGSPLVRVGLLDVHRLVPLQLHTIVALLAQTIMLPFAIAIMAWNVNIMFHCLPLTMLLRLFITPLLLLFARLRLPLVSVQLLPSSMSIAEEVDTLSLEVPLAG